jgi:hypothetical protein
MDVEKMNDSLAAGIKATGGEGEEGRGIGGEAMSDAEDEDDVPIVMLGELRQVEAEVERLKAESERLRIARDEAVNLLMEWAYDRGVILHLGKDYDSREKFREFIAKHGIKVHRHERTCFDDSGPEGTGAVVVCGRAEGVEYSA